MQIQHQRQKGTIVFLESVTYLKEGTEEIKNTVDVRVTWEDGTVYEGQISREEEEYMVQGRGKLQFKDGSYYDGEFKKGKMHGQGKYFWGESGHWFEGGYHEGVKHGEGCYHFGHDRQTQG